MPPRARALPSASKGFHGFLVGLGFGQQPIAEGPDQAPEAAALLAASLGLSRMFPDDLRQLEKGMMLYNAFYRWARDGVGDIGPSPREA